MCHVLTVFTFYPSVSCSHPFARLLSSLGSQVKYAYKSIAEFVKHVTEPVPESQPQPVFPELKIAVEPPPKAEGEIDEKDSFPSRVASGLKSLSIPFPGGSDKSCASIYESSKAATKEQTQENPSLNRLATFTDSDESVVEDTLVSPEPPALGVSDCMT